MSPLPPSPALPDSLTESPPSWLRMSIGHWRGLHRCVSTRLGWTVYTVTCFVLFLILTFPVDVIVQRIATSMTRGSSWQMQYASGELTWSGACVLHELKVTNTSAPLSQVHIRQLTLRPSLLGVLFGQPWPLTFHAQLPVGSFTGTVHRPTDRVEVSLMVQNVELAQFALLTSEKGGGLKGVVTGNGEWQGDFQDLIASRGTLTLQISDGAHTGGKVAGVPLPPVQNVQVQLQASLTGGRLQVSQLLVKADGIEAQLGGEIVLATPLPRSGLNLQLSAKSIGTPPSPLMALASLLPAVPGVPDERRATISGSFVAPILR